MTDERRLTVDLDHLEARAVVLELLMRAILTMLIQNTRDPLGMVDRFSREFDSTLELLDMRGVDEVQAVKFRQSLLSIFNGNMSALRARVTNAAQQEAAAAGGARN